MLVQGSVMKNKKHFHYKIYSFNVIPQIWADKIIINLTIRASCAPRIIYPAISKLFPEDIFGTLDVCDQYVIKFGKIKNIIG